MKAFIIEDECEECSGEPYRLAKFALIEALLNNKNVSISAPSLRQSNVALNCVKQIIDRLKIQYDYSQAVDNRKICFISENNSQIYIKTCLLSKSREELSNNVMIFYNHGMMPFDSMVDVELIDIRNADLFDLMSKELI